MATVNQSYRFYFTATDSSDLPASGISNVDFTVVVRNPQDTATMSVPTVSEVGSTGLYYFDISATFTDTHGAGEYGIQVSYNSGAPAATGSVSETIEFHEADLGNSALYDLYMSRWGPTIYIDPIYGSPGTDVGVNGTKDNPVNSEADGYALAEALNIRGYWIVNGTITLASGPSDQYDDWTFASQGWSGGVDAGGKRVWGATFHDIRLVGTIDPGPEGQDFNAFNSLVGACTNITATLVKCALHSTLALPTTNVAFGVLGGALILNDCYNWNPDAFPVRISMGGSVPNGTTVRMQGYKGKLLIQNMQQEDADFEGSFQGADVEIENTCTDGYIKLAGLAEVNDNSAGVTIDKSGLSEWLNWEEEQSDHTTSGTSGFSQLLAGPYSSTYGPAVYIDTFYPGSSGAVVGVNGTIDNPTGSIADARTIADALGIRRYVITGAITLNATHWDWEFVGHRGFGRVIIGGQDVWGSKFRELTLQGTFISTAQDGFDIKAYDCVVGSCVNITGSLNDCEIIGPLSLPTVAPTNFPSGFNGINLLSCVSSDASVTINCGQSSKADFDIRNFNGTLNFQNMSNSVSSIRANFEGGYAILDSTISDGQINLNGIFNLTDNKSGGTLDTSGRIGEVTDAYLSTVHGAASWSDTDNGRAITSIAANPGQSVGIVNQVLDANGERVDGYIPQIDYVINPSGTMQSGFPANMTKESTGVYSLNVNIPSGITAVGTYIVSTSWTKPGTALTQYKVYLINVHLPFGVSSVSPA